MQQTQNRDSSNTGKSWDGRFGKGHDPRRNLKGRPREFDHYRRIAQKIGDEPLQLPNGQKITVAEALLRTWVKSKQPLLQKLFAEYCFGKVPDKIEATGLENKTSLILHWPHERPDLARANGSDNGRS